jgi:hypothetical protein
MGSVRALPPLTVQGSRHFGHSSRFPAPLARSGLHGRAEDAGHTVSRLSYFLVIDGRGGSSLLFSAEPLMV